VSGDLTVLSIAAEVAPGTESNWKRQLSQDKHMSKLPLFLALTVASVSAQDKTIDVRGSTITIHVGKAGLFSVAGHEQWVNAPISAGRLNDSDPLHVEWNSRSTLERWR
jgi:myo-inositol catabolism protein IolC